MGDLDNYENSQMDMRQKATMSAKDFIELNSKKAVKKFGKGSKKQPEFALQVAVCEYLRLNHPQSFFLSDTVASLELTFGQMTRNKKIQKSDFYCPDIIIFEPRGRFAGLMIELKVDNPYTLKGEIKSSDKDRYKHQEETILALRGKGYVATFSWSLEQTILIIDCYMEEAWHLLKVVPDDKKR